MKCTICDIILYLFILLILLAIAKYFLMKLEKYKDYKDKINNFYINLKNFRTSEDIMKENKSIYKDSLIKYQKNQKKLDDSMNDILFSIN